MVHTIAKAKEMNVHIFKVQAIDERVDCEDHFTASLGQERSFRILTQRYFPIDLAYWQY